MSRFLLYGQEGLATSLAYRLLLEDCEVGYCILDKDSQEHLDGMGIQKFTQVKPALQWVGMDGYVIADDETDMTWCRQAGYKCWGGNKWLEKLEMDRVFQSKVAERCKVPIPNYQKVTNIDEGIRFIRSHPDMYCIKQMGHAPKEFSYVGKTDNGSDVIEQLEWIKQHPKAKEMSQFMLQEGAPGLEFAVGAWWIGYDWLRDATGNVVVYLNREHKKSLEHDLGLSCGEMGTVACITTNSKLFEMMLEPLTDWLLENCPDCVQHIDANVGIRGKDEAWLYEYTPRLGYPAHALQEALLDMPACEFYADLIDKRQGTIRYKSGWCVGTVIGCGDFPTEASDDVSNTFKGQPVHFDWSENALPEYIKWGNADYYEVADDYSWVATVCFIDNDIAIANDRCVETMEQINVRAPVYRTDIGVKFAKDELPQLIEWGYVDPEDETNVSDEQEALVN